MINAKQQGDKRHNRFINRNLRSFSHKCAKLNYCKMCKLKYAILTKIEV